MYVQTASQTANIQSKKTEYLSLSMPNSKSVPPLLLLLHATTDEILRSDGWQNTALVLSPRVYFGLGELRQLYFQGVIFDGPRGKKKRVCQCFSPRNLGETTPGYLHFCQFLTAVKIQITRIKMFSSTLSLILCSQLFFSTSSFLNKLELKLDVFFQPLCILQAIFRLASKQLLVTIAKQN
jgi:hypothetical protein